MYAGTPKSVFLQKVQEIIRVHQNNDVAVAFGIAAARVLEAALLLPAPTSTTSLPFLQALDSCYDTLSDDIEMILGPDKASIRDMVLESFQRGKSAAMALVEYPTLDDLLLQLSHEKMKDTPENAFYDMAARNCALPGAFTGPMYLLCKYALQSSGPNNNNDTTTISSTPWDDNVLLMAIRENIFAAGDTCGRAVFLGAVLAAATSPTTSPTTTTSALSTLLNQMESVTKERVNSYATMMGDLYDPTNVSKFTTTTSA
jgi:ADP-ribosylglycohydrolase